MHGRGASDSVAIDANGNVAYWGWFTTHEGFTSPPSGTYRDISCWGNPDEALLTPPAGVGFAEVTIGDRHACALNAAREAVCWGDDATGQVSKTPSGTWESIDAGRYLTCGVRPDGSIECWGCAGTDDVCTWGTPVPPEQTIPS